MIDALKKATRIYEPADLAPLTDVPRMSTDWIGQLIHHCVRGMASGHSYVNVGVWHGYSLLAGMLENPNRECVGVDNFSEFGAPREEFMLRFKEHASMCHSFFDGDFVDYFRDIHEAPIGFYYYDGSHDYQSQFRALELASPYLVAGSLILVDDTNWDAPRSATQDFIAMDGRPYDVLLDIKTAGNLSPFFWNGLMLLQVGHEHTH